MDTTGRSTSLRNRARSVGTRSSTASRTLPLHPARPVRRPQTVSRPLVPLNKGRDPEAGFYPVAGQGGRCDAAEHLPTTSLRLAIDINRCRRTVRDYERHPAHHAAMAQRAMVIVMTRRLARHSHADR